VSEVCKEFAIDKEAVMKKEMKRNKTRDIAIFSEITASLHVKRLVWKDVNLSSHHFFHFSLLLSSKRKPCLTFIVKYN